MKVAILAPNFFVEVKEVHGRDRVLSGGGERYLYELCKLLQSEGHYVTVFQPLRVGRAGIDKNGIERKISFGQVNKVWNGIDFICMQDEDRYGYGVNPTMNMYFNENARHYDVAVYFGTYMAFPYAVSPSISISHGIYWDYPYHAYSLSNTDRQRQYLEKHLYGFTDVDLCVAVDSNVKRVIQSIKPGAEKKIKIISNFVDTEVFTPKKNKNNKLKILCPRRLTVLRGSNEFIKASQEHPEYDYLSVGESLDERAQDSLEKWGKTTPHMRFINLEMDKMYKVYQEADISVIPTIACEGLSLSLLESMASGLPVIVTPNGGLMDAIIDGYNGLVYDPQFDDLGEFITKLAKDKEMMEKFSERNRQIAVDCFDIKIWQQKWRDILSIFK